MSACLTMQCSARGPAARAADRSRSAEPMTRDASDQNLRIEHIEELPDDFGDLIALSLREDFYAMQRIRDDWDAGTNRFDRPGEIVLEARAGARLVGICGLNRDPYAQSSDVGRVRHLYGPMIGVHCPERSCVLV